MCTVGPSLWSPVIPQADHKQNRCVRQKRNEHGGKKLLNRDLQDDLRATEKKPDRTQGRETMERTRKYQNAVLASL